MAEEYENKQLQMDVSGPRVEIHSQGPRQPMKPDSSHGPRQPTPAAPVAPPPPVKKG